MFQGFFKGFAKGLEEQQGEDEIARAVGKVEGDAAYPLGKYHFPAAYEIIGQRVEQAEHKPMQRGDDGPDEGRAVLSQQHRGDGEGRRADR